jgi:DHA2 family multidrug resistance protein-like MFS transporter
LTLAPQLGSRGQAPADGPAQTRQWLVLAVLCLSVFMVVVDNTIVNVGLPTISRTLGSSITGLQWIVDAYSLAFAGLLLAGGGIGDRLGRRRVMEAGLVAFATFSVLAAWSSSTGSLIASRALMGVAAAFVFPASLAVLTDVFRDPAQRQKALGVWGATSGAAVAFGPVTGGALLQHFWFGSIFCVNVPIAAVALAGTRLLIPRSAPTEHRRFDTRGTLASTAGVSLLTLAIIEGPQWGWAAGGTLACFVLAVLLLAGFAVAELRTDPPLLDVRVFALPRFSAGAASIAVVFFCLFGFIFLITQYLQFVKGYSTLAAGVRTLPFAAVAAVCTPLGALAALRVGKRAVVGTGLAVMAGGLVLAGLTSRPSTAYFGPILASMVLISLGLSLVTAPSTEAVMGTLARDQVGAGAAVNNTTRELGGTLGVAVLGSVFASAYSPGVLSSFGRYPIPAAAMGAAHRSLAGALEVANRAPALVRPALRADAFAAFGSGLKLACLVAAAVAAAGALAASALLPGRGRAAGEAGAADGAPGPGGSASPAPAGPRPALAPAGPRQPFPVP